MHYNTAILYAQPFQINVVLWIRSMFFFFEIKSSISYIIGKLDVYSPD